jgi:hypothetical protein
MVETRGDKNVTGNVVAASGYKVQGDSLQLNPVATPPAGNNSLFVDSSDSYTLKLKNNSGISGPITDPSLVREVAEHEIEILELQANASIAPFDHDTMISDTYSDADGYENTVAALSVSNATWMKMDGTARDVFFGNTPTTDSGVVYITGLKGQAAQYDDGTSDRSNVSTSFPNVTTTMAFSAWFRLNTVPAATRNIFGIPGNPGGAANDVHLSINTSRQLVWTVGTGSAAYSITGTTVLSTATWYHVIAVMNGNAGQPHELYLNNILEASGVAPSVRGTGGANANFYVGQVSSGLLSAGMDVDDFAVWNTIPTAYDRSKMYNGGVAASYEDIVTVSGLSLYNNSTKLYGAGHVPSILNHYKLDEASGNAITAVAGGIGNLTLSGTVAAQTGKLGGARGPYSSGNVFSVAYTGFTVNSTPTFSAWVKPIATPTTNQQFFSVGNNTVNGPQFIIGYDGTTGRWYAQRAKSGVASVTSFLTLPTPVVGTWYHITGRFPGTAAVVAVNGYEGSPDANTSITGTTPASATATLGGSFLGGNEATSWHIDDVRVYSVDIGAGAPKRLWNDGNGVENSLGAIASSVYHDRLPTITGTVTHVQVVGRTTRQSGDNVQFYVGDGTNWVGPFAENTKTSTAGLSGNPTVFRALLTPGTSPTAYGTSLKTYCIKLFKA